MCVPSTTRDETPHPDHPFRKRSLCWILAAGGWIIALLLTAMVGPHLYGRWVTKLPSSHQAEWLRIIQERKAELGKATWQDPRPLHLFAGDSQIEGGNWYHLLEGRIAVRNCGLSRSRIQDVSELIRAIPDRNPEAVILMCGINDLMKGASVEECLTDYEQLLRDIEERLKPAKIIVLSVMPLRQTIIDRDARQTNAKVATFNRLLETMCQRMGVSFHSVNGAVTDENGGLSDELTPDGLHLNEKGYRKLAAAIRVVIEPSGEASQ